MAIVASGSVRATRSPCHATLSRPSRYRFAADREELELVPVGEGRPHLVDDRRPVVDGE